MLKVTITKNAIEEFAESTGAEAVWTAWRSMMLQLGREVPHDKMYWSTLPYEDKELDKYVATRVVVRFLTWIGGKYVVADGDVEFTLSSIFNRLKEGVEGD